MSSYRSKPLRNWNQQELITWIEELPHSKIRAQWKRTIIQSISQSEEHLTGEDIYDCDDAEDIREILGIKRIIAKVFVRIIQEQKQNEFDSMVESTSSLNISSSNTFTLYVIYRGKQIELRDISKNMTIREIECRISDEIGININGDSIQLTARTKVLQNNAKTLEYYGITDGSMPLCIRFTVHGGGGGGQKEEKKQVVITKENFLQDCANKKKEIQELPSLANIKSNCKEAEELTDKILKSNNDNLNNRDTLLNILGNIGQKNGKNCLFYDSNKMKLKTEANTKKELKFTLNLEGFESDQKVENEVDTALNLKSCINKKKAHPILTNFKEKLSKVYNVAANQIKIVDIFCGTINITYVVDIPKEKLEAYYKQNITGGQQNITDKMKKQFKQYKDCKIHALLYRDSFDINLFSELGNKTFSSGSTYKVGPKGKEQNYIQPSGWVRFGLNIVNSCKYGSDHTWLRPFQNENNWYRCYHGTKNGGSDKGKSVDVMAWIHSGGFHWAGATAYGPGVYCSPDPVWLEKNYAGIHEVNGRKYKFMLQCGVNPNGVRICGDKYCGNDWQGGSPPWGPIWVAKGPKEIRPYGILIKEL